MLYQESLVIRRELADRQAIAASLTNIGIIASLQGDYHTSNTLYEESLRIRRELGDKNGIANSLNNMGNIETSQRKYAAAQQLYEQSLEIRRELGDRQGSALCLYNLGNSALKLDRCDSARLFLKESVQIYREIGDLNGTAQNIELLAVILMEEGTLEKAANLWGSAERLREEINIPTHAHLKTEQDGNIAKLRATLTEEDFKTAWENGRAMTIEQAIESALQKQ